MFIDYYEILGVSISATSSVIKTAWRKLAIKYHPDKNPDRDTTKRMQSINEAYMILRDAEARKRYDIEYRHYNTKSDFESKEPHRESSEEYVFTDKILEDWILKAKIKSIELARRSLEDLIGMSSVGVKAATKEASSHLAANIVISLIAMLVFGLIGSGC